MRRVGGKEFDCQFETGCGARGGQNGLRGGVEWARVKGGRTLAGLGIHDVEVEAFTEVETFALNDGDLEICNLEIVAIKRERFKLLRALKLEVHGGRHGWARKAVKSVTTSRTFEEEGAKLQQILPRLGRSYNRYSPQLRRTVRYADWW
jgi:hypothetical protein